MKSTIKVLIVEDTDDAADMIKAMLASSMFPRFTYMRVTTLDSASHILTNDKSYDAVLLDLGLPDSDGLETVRKMHEAFPTIPIVVLTAQAGRDITALTEMALEMGAQDFFPKTEVSPFGLHRSILLSLARMRNRELEEENKRLADITQQNRDTSERREKLIQDLRSTNEEPPL